ncbi:hypothetical protein [Massilia sp. PWRC2]|uniref:hypothetical protein n=1 Tax=Massilia sp. PWRC2 TaxID=2804626 RepID=UPI003CEAA37B
MHIKITSIATEEVGSVLGRVSVAMEDALNPLFERESYGDIEQFMLVIVAVDSDVAENSRFVAAHNKIRNFRHPATLARFKSMSFSLSFDPVYIESKSESQIRRLVSTGLLAKLDNPGLKIPVKFDYIRFVADLRLAIRIYVAAIDKESHH